MKKNYPFSIALIIPLVLFLTAYHTGSPGGKTNSPGDGFNNCTDCHSGTPINASNWIESNIPADGYEPGQVYEFTLTGSHEAPGRFGFEITAEDESGTKVGQFASLDDETQLTNNMDALTHTDQGITPNGDFKSWTFNWTAPDPGVGNVSFYAALNAANGDGTNSGDVIYLTNETYQEHITGIETPLVRGFSAYPNPAANHLWLRTNQDLQGGKLSIVSLSGQTVFSSQIMHKLRRISLEGLKPGLYFIILDHKGDKSSSKLIIR